MNIDEIKAIATESGIDFCSSDHAILTFASRIESLVREEIATLLENNMAGTTYFGGENKHVLTPYDKDTGMHHAGITYAAAIRKSEG